MLKIGDQCQLTIDDMSDEGQGIGKVEGMAVFVRNAVVGDKVKIRITKVKKRYAFAELEEMIEKSPYRIEKECRYGGQCGGCTYRNLSYDGQLQLKEKQVIEKIKRIGGVTQPDMERIVGMATPYNYRNKAQMPVSTGGIITKKGGIIQNLGKPMVGFFKAKSHEVVDCQDCLLQAPTAMVAADTLREFMTSDNITGYDPKWEKGLIKHLIVKTALGTGEVMVMPVINGKGIPNSRKLIEMLDERIYGIPTREDGVKYSLESVILNINKGNTNEVLGEECITLAGKPTILEKVGDISYEISPLAFYQVNPVQMKVLYDKVLEYADFKGTEKVLDLYCGVGSIGIYCANHMRNLNPNFEKMGQVVGIESVKGAVIDANRNAVINNIVNARFICGKAEDEISKVISGYVDKEGFTVPAFCPDVVILDPPRAGCDERLLEAAAGANPEKIIYVSCDPATMARDIKRLGELGYNFVKGQCIDFYPWTKHVETVALLSKLDVDKHIDVEIKLDELDLTSAESKASYAQIKEYILEKFDLKVSTLYIAQIKKKCGIVLRENYNKSKKEKQVIPQCTPEKEEAIMDALRHFKMI